MIVALLGAESTGKTWLSEALAAALPGLTGWRCTAVPEVLRAWCDREGRTPRPDEQGAIAEAQASRLLQAAAGHELVIADTTPLMTALYSELLFNDPSLWPMALRFHHDHVATVLLTALDLPWVADGLQRDGPQVRPVVDAALRRALADAGLGWSVVAGVGDARLDSALDALTPLLLAHRPPADGLQHRRRQQEAARPRWQRLCEDCDDPDCEHAARRGLLPRDGGQSGGRGP
jgi:nicotinamide riboside kinase